MILLPTSSFEVRETRSKGRGVFAKAEIHEGTIVAKYTGKIMRYEDIDYEKYEDYLMYYDDEYGIIPDLDTIGAHLINHSCSPNCFLFPFEKHIFFFAIQDIKAGQEITINYMMPPKSKSCLKKCKHICRCRSKNCKGTMHLSEADFAWWQELICEHKKG